MKNVNDNIGIVEDYEPCDLPNKYYQICEAYTTKGVRCTLKSRRGKLYCSLHDNRYNDELSPTLKDIFRKAQKYGKHTSDLTDEVTLIRGFISKRMREIKVLEIEKEECTDKEKSRAIEGYIRFTEKEVVSLSQNVSKIVEAACKVELQYNKTVPIEVVASLVVQLVDVIKHAVGGDRKIMNEVKQGISQLRLPISNPDVVL